MHCYFCHDALDETITFYTGPSDGQMSIYGKPVHAECGERVYNAAWDAYVEQEDFTVPSPERLRKARRAPQFVAKDYTNA